MPTDNATINDVLDFWFSDTMQPYWFNSSPEIDATLQENFEQLHLKARLGEFLHWEKSAQGLLALIILLDQIPLNIYRGLPDSFSTEAKAITLSKKLIKKELLSSFDKAQQLFALLPLSHSEAIEDQNLVLSVAATLGWNEDDTHWLKHHHSIIEKYGRFPHRNAILGRQSRIDELAYLSSEEAFTG